jgi:DUF971 family protein
MKFGEGTLDLNGESLEIRWDSGRTQHLRAAGLRVLCPCATCRHLTMALEPSMFPGLKMEKVELVGSYALQLTFSDGHSQGAYSFDRLLELPDEI